jgi:hypothetical protein
MVFQKGYMATDSELQGEKKCGLKPLLDIAKSGSYIRSYPEVTCMKGLMEKELAPEL